MNCMIFSGSSWLLPRSVVEFFRKTKGFLFLCCKKHTFCGNLMFSYSLRPSKHRCQALGQAVGGSLCPRTAPHVIDLFGFTFGCGSKPKVTFWGWLPSQGNLF